ncbi:type VII toxin-antitoxin system HepT family RNase toxin [Virgibacillus sp. W0181]|uniref:type VII toxin-antitoxin system HepT family RNase toxin n=1 Tax=Virgibacillus sp. W0181 TaxID=3391581 RepID=UPI003F47B96A
MENDVLLNKAHTIERCIIRIQEVYENNPKSLHNYTKQDSIILNIQRACEASIDMAMHVIAKRKLGVPQSSRDGFHLLADNGVINKTLCENMKAMVGFRNIAVHDYTRMQIEIVEKIIEKHLQDFDDFKAAIIKDLQ